MIEDNDYYNSMDVDELSDNLFIAATNNKIDLVKYLLTSPNLKRHANINYKDDDGLSILLTACNFGNLEIVKYLLTSPELKKRANINDKDYSFKNVIMLACEANKGINLELIRFLIIDMNFSINNKTINWLEGKNYDKKIYHDVLKIIKIRDLHEKLETETELINNKKSNIDVKKIKI